MSTERGRRAGGPGRRACFLDRDGTLVRELDWIVSPDQLELLPGAARAVARLNEAGWTVVLATNQSAVGRGLVDEAGLERIHARLAQLLAREGARLDAIEWCPHHPTEAVGAYRRACGCRKPAPGLLLRAAERLGLDLAASAVIGDAGRDLEAAHRAGVGRAILVQSGKGERELARLAAEGAAPPEVARDLAEAVGMLLDGA
jgi:D-glycero-D-manno-heptose 1,7-bisphosphate phosphatase